jgi:hypothetical protein
MTKTARLVLVVLLVLLSLGILGPGIVLLYNPTWITGEYYELTVLSVRFESQGDVIFTCNDRIPYDTGALCEHGNHRQDFVIRWANHSPGLLRFPRKAIGESWRESLLTQEELDSGEISLPTVRSRFQLTPGTYRIRHGEEIVLAIIPKSDGGTREVRVRLSDDPNPASISHPSPGPERP